MAHTVNGDIADGVHMLVHLAATRALSLEPTQLLHVGPNVWFSWQAELECTLVESDYEQMMVKRTQKLFETSTDPQVTRNRIFYREKTPTALQD